MTLKMIRKIITIGFIIASAVMPYSLAYAASAADALLNATRSPNETTSVKQTAEPTYITPSLMAMDEIKLSSPVARQIFADWIASGSKNYEMNSWFKNFLKDQFEPTSHLWTAMGSKLPDNLSASGRAAYLFSLYQLGLPQTFLNQWLTSMNSNDFANSKAAAALEESIAPDFDSWFEKNSLQLSVDQEATIQQMGPSRSSVFTSLTAVTFLRKGEAGAELLAKLPVNSVYRPLLAQTAAIALAKRNDLGNAAKVLKTYFEPWLVSAKDPKKLAIYYLEIARLLYRAGALEGAVSYYQKVPSGMPEYLTAREELSWCWLRMGDTEHLRGNLETLTSRAVENLFQPETFLVRAVSNLKFCYYGEVEKDFESFRRVNAYWAKTIEANLAIDAPAPPRTMDRFSERAVRMIKARESELNTLKGLSDRSVSAVGIQAHWTESQNQIVHDLESAKKTQITEFRRQWKNDKQTLTEAIRKMQFVKVELLSQVAATKDSDQVLLSAASAQKSAPSNPATQFSGKDTIVFPFDGVIWPDELFRLRSLSRGRCLGQ